MKRFFATMASKTPKRFAPLQPGVSPSSGAPLLRGIVFDMDGTLCLPQNYMFGLMRAALDIPKSIDILDHIASLPVADQPAANAAIHAIESDAMKKQAPQPGLTELMTYLDSRGLPKAICTRNVPGPVDHLVTKFLSDCKPFDPIVTRELSPPKPHPAGILHIAKAWGLVDQSGEGDASGLIMVGDSVDDMTAGRRAGAATVLLVNKENEHLRDHENTDLVISRLDELTDILDKGFDSSKSM